MKNSDGNANQKTREDEDSEDTEVSSESSSGNTNETKMLPGGVIVPPPLPPPSKPQKQVSTLSPLSHIATEEALKLPRTINVESASGYTYDLQYPIHRNENNVIFAVSSSKKGKQPTLHAMKVEVAVENDENRYEGSLKTELEVLTKISKIRSKMPVWGSHFIEMVDCGAYRNLRFIVSTLCGPNLKVLRSYVLKRNFTMSAALLINFNTFAAIHDLHKIGYVHSVVRPTHFVIGMGELSHVIYIIGFSRCAASILTCAPKKREGKRALKFMSRNVMDGKRCTFQDDLESWLYMSIDIVNDSLLPWSSQTDAKEMRRMKCEMFYLIFGTELDSNIPDEYRAIINVLNSTKNYSAPKYDRILSLLRDGLRHRNLDQKELWQNYVDKSKITHPPLYSSETEKFTKVTDSFLKFLLINDGQPPAKSASSQGK